MAGSRGKLVAYGASTLFMSLLHNVFLLYHIKAYIHVFKISESAFWIGELVGRSAKIFHVLAFVGILTRLHELHAASSGLTIGRFFCCGMPATTSFSAGSPTACC